MSHATGFSMSMNSFYIFLLILTTFYNSLFITLALVPSNQNWDINYPCQEYVRRLAEQAGQMTECAIRNAIPPSVCTSCFSEYINFKQEEYRTQHLNSIFSIDNKTCTAVIYENYVLSYSHELAISITMKIWEASRCDSCLDIHWDFQHENSSVIDLNNKTHKFIQLLRVWRDCVSNTSISTNEQSICKQCTTQFTHLFDYYWDIYPEPGVDFCIDIESMMNDTFHLWEQVWGCSDDPRNADRHQDIRVVAFSATLLLIVIGLFYAGSYIQSEQAQANLIQYSRMQEPQGSRFRLLSSSTLDSSSHIREAHSTPSSSQHGWGRND